MGRRRGILLFLAGEEAEPLKAPDALEAPDGKSWTSLLREEEKEPSAPKPGLAATTSSTSKMPFACQACGRGFASKTLMKIHEPKCGGSSRSKSPGVGRDLERSGSKSSKKKRKGQRAETPEDLRV